MANSIEASTIQISAELKCSVGTLVVATQDRDSSDFLVQAFAPLHRSAMGTAVGIVLGTIVFFATLVSIGRDPRAAQHLGLLSQFFPGYSVTSRGAFVGLAEGFIAGYVVGWTLALLRNLAVWVYLVGLRSRSDAQQYADFLDHL